MVNQLLSLFWLQTLFLNCHKRRVDNSFALELICLKSLRFATAHIQSIPKLEQTRLKRAFFHLIYKRGCWGPPLPPISSSPPPLPQGYPPGLVSPHPQGWRTQSLGSSSLVASWTRAHIPWPGSSYEAQWLGRSSDLRRPTRFYGILDLTRSAHFEGRLWLLLPLIFISSVGPLHLRPRGDHFISSSIFFSYHQWFGVDSHPPLPNNNDLRRK